MPKGPRKLVITFGSQTLTHYGGVYLLHRFLTRIGLKNAIATEIRFIQRNNRYTVGELLLAILYPIILGLERIETTQLLQHNGVFRYLSGLAAYPDPSTLRRFLLRIAPQALTRLRKLHDRLLAKMIAKPHRPSRLIFDLDSTVLVVYGKQQGAEVGYNPTKRGRRSYHPLLCFEGRTKDFWHGELRPGNVHTARYPGSAQSLLWQNPASSQTCDHPRRQRVLRPKHCRVAGGKQSALCHRRQTHPTYQAQAGSPEIRLRQYRSANSRILLSAHSLAPPLPIRSYSTTSTRRVGPTADLVQTRELPLPGPGDQSRSETPQPLALLQWSSGHRAHYPRTQGGLPFGQDPHASLPRQRGLLASLTIGLQLSELVQAAVFAPRVSDRYTRYFAQSHSLNACATASDRQSASAGYAGRWPARKCLETCSS